MPVEGLDDEVVQLTFTKQFLSYFPDEVAAFLPEQAEAIVGGGYANGPAILLSGEVLDPDALTTTLAAIANGGFAVTIKGVVKQVGPIDFSGVSGTPEAASLISEALEPEAGCQYVAPNNFAIMSYEAGAGVTITYASAPASGTDISASCQLTSATGATLTQGG